MSDPESVTGLRGAPGRNLGVVAGVALLPVCVVVWAFGADALSGWGLAEATLTTLLAVRLLSLKWAPPRPRLGPGRSMALGLLAIFLLRAATIGDGGHGRLVVLPSGGTARFVDRLFEERDAAILGSRLLVALGVLGTPEAPTLAPALEAGYARLDSDSPGLGTPIPATYLGLERPAAFDTYVFSGERPSRTAVVFLHGYAGSFLLWCWQVAALVRGVPADTWCPATGSRGHWWSSSGERTARATIEAARAAGAERVVLVGLSNGGVGASRLAPRLSGELDGLVLLSGADPGATAAGVPTLLLHGRDDGHMSVEVARAYAESVPDAELVELDGTHYVLLDDRDAIGASLRGFLSRL